MANSYLTNIHTRKIITAKVIFIICKCENMYNKKEKNMYLTIFAKALHHRCSTGF